MQIDTSNKLYSKEELAIHFHVSVSTIDTWVRKGKLVPALKVGKRVLFDKDTAIQVNQLSTAINKD